jgi:hypothetical protein
VSGALGRVAAGLRRVTFPQKKRQAVASTILGEARRMVQLDHQDNGE